jgi:heme/copper-type cytochrome/quinol oxidase subunit 2
MTFFLWINSHADAPSPWQMGFQDPATAAMEGIVDLHHDICFFLVTILVLVLWLGGRIVTGFHHTLQPMPERFNHHTNLELVWAILPSIIVTLIALPSLTLIYTFDDLVARPALTVKVVGFQWGWRYECKEHVQLSLINPDHLLSLSIFKLASRVNTEQPLFFFSQIVHDQWFPTAKATLGLINSA